jgi:predicted ABC-type ATPase
MVCGPNGAGKSTYTKVAKVRDRFPVIDPDKIAIDGALSPIAAGREAYRRTKEFLTKGLSFVRESTLTANFDFNLMREAKEKGYDVSIAYIGLNSGQEAIERVKFRQSLGGHGVPEEDVLRRFERGLNNLPKAIALADRVRLIDNSKSYVLVADIERGQIITEYQKPHQRPDWYRIVRRIAREQGVPFSVVPDS